ncbi:MAG: hypothetical protein E7480_03455 [Ruminococcaceae bacterium]|nr:hypothetical protein [Oscillospiraceae bacterium]
MNNSSSDINILDNSAENSEVISSAASGQQSSSDASQDSASDNKVSDTSSGAASSTAPTQPSVDYGDVKPVAYNPSTSLTGSIQINLNQIINSNIIGPGVNFDFSCMVPVNLETGAEWENVRSQHIPYTFKLTEKEAKKEWDNYFKLIDFMDFKYVRMSVSISQWEPVNDNNDPHNTDFKNGFVFSPGYEKKHPEVSKNNFLYMEAMYKILDHFEKTGKYVVLANWDRGGGEYCPDGQNWLSLKKPDGSDYGLSDRDRLYVTDLEEYTESMAAIMYHLKVEKGYNCVKGISFWNEPEGLIDYENVLASVYNSLGAQLRRLGIRDKVLIQAFDGATFWNNEKGWVDDQVSRLISKCGDNMDIISLHDYFSRMDYLKNTPDGITHGTLSDFQLPRLINPAVTQAKADGKDRIVVMGELGTFAFGGNVETRDKNYKLQLHNAEAIISGLNNGVKAFGNWIYNLVYHKYYAMLDVGKNRFNEREFSPDDINYYPTSLYTKYIKSGSDVVKTSVSGLKDSNGQRVHCVTVKKGDDVTVLLVNDASRAASVKLQGLPSKTFYHHYVYNGKTDRIYPGINYEPAKNNEIFLRPQSITVLTTYSYGTQTVR